MFGNDPGMLCVGREDLPRDRVLGHGGEELPLCLRPLARRHDVIPKARLCSRLTDCDGDADAGANLIIKDVPALLTPPLAGRPGVSAEVEMVDSLKILSEMLSETVKCEALEKAIVLHEADDSIPAFKAVGRPPEKADIGVIDLRL